MKYLRGLSVVFVIFVLPAGSWYYLQSGYNYRLQALEELEPKGQFINLDLEQENQDLLEDKVTLVCLCEDANQEELTTLDNIEDKYDSRGFQVLRLKQDAVDYSNISATYGAGPLFLIDKDRELRSTYDFEEDEIKELVKHAAIVIPLPSRKKIKLKREG